MSLDCVGSEGTTVFHFLGVQASARRSGKVGFYTEAHLCRILHASLR